MKTTDLNVCVSLVMMTLAFNPVGATPPNPEPGQETVTVRVLDSRGKPPHRRTYKTLRVADLARLEALDAADGDRESRVDFSGHPPFRRH